MGTAECAVSNLWLKAKWQQVLKEADALNTKRGHTTGQRAFVRFMLSFGEGPVVPVSDDDLSMFYVFQAQTCKVSTLKAYTAGIRRLHLECSESWVPVSHRYRVAQTMRGLRRIFGDCAKPKLAITLYILVKMYFVMEFSDDNMHTLWAAMLTALLCLLRKDNVCVGKVNAFNVRRVLRRKDFAIEKETVWVRLGFSKTIQFHERSHVVAMKATGGLLCPQKAVENCFKRVPAKPGFHVEVKGQGCANDTWSVCGGGEEADPEDRLGPEGLFGPQFQKGGSHDCFQPRGGPPPH